MATAEQLKAAFHVTSAACAAIREVREVPSGFLYARMIETLPQLTLEAYQTMLRTIVRAELITVKNDLIRWIGP